MYAKQVSPSTHLRKNVVNHPVYALFHPRIAKCHKILPQTVIPPSQLRISMRRWGKFIYKMAGLEHHSFGNVVTWGSPKIQVVFKWPRLDSLYLKRIKVATSPLYTNCKITNNQIMWLFTFCQSYPSAEWGSWSIVRSIIYLGLYSIQKQYL